MNGSMSVQKCICRVPRRILLHHHLLPLPFRCCQRPRQYPLSDHCWIAQARRAAQNHHQGPGRDGIEDACPLGGTRLVVAGACLGDETCVWTRGQTWRMQSQTTHRAGQ
eukprot:1199530-Pleurochrysis_carterae.AAC.1